MAINVIKVDDKTSFFLSSHQSIWQIQSAMSAFKYAILSIFFISGGTKAQDFVGICNQMKNPLGTCDCPGNTNQLWISADCTEVNKYFFSLQETVPRPIVHKGVGYW